METVTLKAFFHNATECIGIFSGQNATLNYYFQKRAGAKWSAANKCWYVACTEKNYELLAKTLSGKAILDIDALRAYLLEKRSNMLPATAANQNKIVAKAGHINTPVINSKLPVRPNLIKSLSKENDEALQKFKQHLVLKSYSASTIRTYTNELLQFLYTVKDRPASEFCTSRIKDYLQYCHTKLKLSEATLHSRMNALKFYLEQVLKKEKFF